MRPFDHTDWLEACPDEYRELAIAVGKMRLKLNDIWSEGGGDEAEEPTSLGHRPLSELAEMVGEMVHGTALPDMTDCERGEPGHAIFTPVCDIGARQNAALHAVPWDEGKARQWRELQALGGRGAVSWDEKGRATYRCWNCGRPSVCEGITGVNETRTPCGW